MLRDGYKAGRSGSVKHDSGKSGLIFQGAED